MAEAVAVFTLLVNSSTVYVSPLFIATWDPVHQSRTYRHQLIQDSLSQHIPPGHLTWMTSPLAEDPASPSLSPQYTLEYCWRCKANPNVRSSTWGKTISVTIITKHHSCRVMAVTSQTFCGLCLMIAPSAHRFRGFQAWPSQQGSSTHGGWACGESSQHDRAGSRIGARHRHSTRQALPQRFCSLSK